MSILVVTVQFTVAKGGCGGTRARSTFMACFLKCLVYTMSI